jgi:hypothetical protein
MPKPTEEEKTHLRRADRKAFFAYLDKRIPTLHAAGVLGSSARAQAEQEYRLANRADSDRRQDRQDRK